MAISRKKKEEMLAEYVEELKNSRAVIVTSYRGLKVNQLQKLRAKIRDANGSFAVVKNTLVQRALEETGSKVTTDIFTGPVGVGFCHDNVPAVAKAITDFAKENDLLQIRGGLLGARVIDEAAVRSLATLPPLEVLRAQLLGLINAPASQLVGVVAGGVRQLVNVVHAYSEKETSAAAEVQA